MRKQDIASSIRKISDGLLKNFSGQSLIIANETWTSNALAQRVDAAARRIDDVAVAYATWRELLASQRRDFVREDRPLIDAIRRTVEAQKGRNSQAWIDCGFPPVKTRRRLTAIELAARTEKLRATRAARRTMGRRQRLLVTGNVAIPVANDPASVCGHPVGDKVLLAAFSLIKDHVSTRGNGTGDRAASPPLPLLRCPHASAQLSPTPTSTSSGTPSL